MADKKYRLTFALSDGSSKNVQFTAPQGPTGPSGADGYTPVKGTDYWTAADQESIVQQVITALGTPVFGTVDTENNITLTGDLAKGTYTVKYEDAEGNQTTIGTLSTGPAYTNLLPTSTDNDFTTVYNGVGYKSGVRWSASSGVEKDLEGSYLSGWMSCKQGDVIRVKNVTMNQNDGLYAYTCSVYWGDNDTIIGSNSQPEALNQYCSPVWDESGQLIQITVPWETATHFRIGASYIGPDSIVTVNEEID